MKINNLESFLAKIASGRIPCGCVITLADPTVTEVAADVGMDFCWLDGEHGIIDRETMLKHIMALRGTDCAPFVRVPDSSHTEIKKVIDMAPAGIIVPMVTSLEQARLAVAACRYPPEGNRGCSFRRNCRYGAEENAEYLRIAGHDPLVILQLEHIGAVECLDEILALPGLDSILIGPYDLSASLGCIGQMDNPELNRIIDEVCRKTLAAGKLLGAYSGPSTQRWLDRGVQYIAVVNDHEALFSAFHAICEEVRRTHGNSTPVPKDRR
ncbi:MAG: hypothetical protein IJJ33_01430 [Victivallales bacterium]|nr:hypothetical protein [Victivallales bacterium]